VVEKPPRVLAPPAPIEVTGRDGGRETLDTRTDRHRAQVLLQPLAIANGRITTAGKLVDKDFLGDHLQPDLLG